jgi:hypothetical protein
VNQQTEFFQTTRVNKPNQSMDNGRAFKEATEAIKQAMEASKAAKESLENLKALREARLQAQNLLPQGEMIGKMETMSNYIKSLEQKSRALCDALYGKENSKSTTGSGTQSATAETKNSTTSTPVETLLDKTIGLVKQFRTELVERTDAVKWAQPLPATQTLQTVTDPTSIWPQYTYTNNTVGGKTLLEQAETAHDRLKNVWQEWKTTPSASSESVPTTPTSALGVEDCIRLSKETVVFFNGVGWPRPASMDDKDALKTFFAAKQERFRAQQSLAESFTAIVSSDYTRSTPAASEKMFKQMAKEAKVLMMDQGKGPADVDKLDNAFAQTFGDSIASCDEHLEEILLALQSKQT